MKKKGTVFGKAAGMVLAMTLICGILYTTVVTGASQLFFSDKANGSIIEIDGKKYGCEILAQEFTGEEYMWGRIMNVSAFTDPNPPASGKSPTTRKTARCASSMKAPKPWWNAPTTTWAGGTPVK